jgi:NADPH-dependent 2,4-dienoyl-CoA reductase/sulfur reductase-like enzyme
MPRQLLVIGGDAAGMSAASQARRLLGPDELAITVVERGDTTSYAACGIPYWVAGLVEEREHLVARRAEVFREKQHMDVRLHHEATGIDTDARTVTVRDLGSGEDLTLGYDDLLIATGAQQVGPPVDGLDTPGVSASRPWPTGSGSSMRSRRAHRAVRSSSAAATSGSRWPRRCSSVAWT